MIDETAIGDSGAVEASDGSEFITIRDVYAEGCRYGVDIQDHNRPGQINRHIIVDGLHVRNSYMAVRTRNHDFGHDGLTIRNVTGSDWPPMLPSRSRSATRRTS